MNEPAIEGIDTAPVLSTARERRLLHDLRDLFAHRAEEETAIDRDQKAADRAEERRHREAMEEVDSRAADEIEQERERYETERSTALEELEGKLSEAKHAYRSDRFRIEERATHDETAAKKALREAVWMTETVYEAKQGQPGEKYDQFAKTVSQKRHTLRGYEEQAEAYFVKVRQTALIEPPVEDPGAPTDVPSDEEAPERSARKRMEESVERAQAHLTKLRGTIGPGIMAGIRPFVIALVVVGVAMGVMLWRLNGRLDAQIAYAAIGGLLISGAFLAVVHFGRRGALRREYSAMRTAIRESFAAGHEALHVAAIRRRADEAALLKQRNDDVAASKAKFEPVIERVSRLRAQLLSELETEAKQKLAELKDRRDREIARIDQDHEARQAEMEGVHRTSREAELRRHDETRQAIAQEAGERWAALEDHWKSGIRGARSEINAIQSAAAELFPDWSSGASRWEPRSQTPPAIQFGTMQLDIRTLSGGLSTHPQLQVEMPELIDLPALLDFPQHASVLIEAREQGREAAVDSLQALMLRLLTSLPPGKVRFTIIDPVGLGQNFAGFMHLADYDEQFVANRIWTETRHIEQRLTDLTEHMENVIQKYLRNEYNSITEYNERAGEIAEPFRFLVIANFPANFSEQSARRLASIVESGPRCGVYTLISHDARAQLPPGFQLNDLRSHSVNFVEEGDRFVWNDPDFSVLPTRLEATPASETLTTLIRSVGEQARDASRVELPFEVVVPTSDGLWSESAANQITAPLGQAGATKLQQLALGRGTAQHVLIAGRTGSGKSTLLHVLITSIALRYRPDEVELYLVDFKKGVEFKAYAQHALPHARAVAIESDREFGLSVLQRLDSELKRRGELFRNAHTQDLAGFRRAQPNMPMPRLLLVIDEFQEFFTEDDRIAQEASLLLDRLVRQGRAFGMHILLGSQTLAGAYSLARSTISQMAVRIALQCSETDAGLIMSEDNLAARLLSRPGEAIYNDQSGLIEGNSPFQIVWLPDEKREKYLAEVQRRTEEAGYKPPEPQIVFEGNIPADLRRNRLLQKILSEGRSAAPAAPHAWLGDPIAIRDPMAAVMRRQSGANVVIVGQRDEAALGMLSGAMLGLSAQHDDQARFLLLDATPPDDPLHGSLERIAAFLPQRIQLGGWRDAAAMMQEIHNEVERRLKDAITDAPAWYVIIHGLQRFRDLRKSEDDFSFSSDRSAPVKPDKQFAHILREGPGFGVHSLLWVDTATNLIRSVDRSALREFDTRVLFQMNASDSSNLIDSPGAEKLGPQRAIIYREEYGTAEKFRPYALPDAQWIQGIGPRLVSLATS